MAASNDTKACATACSVAKSGCCKGSAKGVVAANGAFPVVIPAAFYSEAQVCPTTLVKAESCTKVSSSCCSKGAAVVAASATTESGCCKGSGQRADGKPCCGKCVTTASKN
jgi:hypothetical protein